MNGKDYGNIPQNRERIYIVGFLDKNAFDNFEFPDEIENKVKIAEKCNVEFEFGHTILPNFNVDSRYKTHYDFFKEECDKGIRKRYSFDGVLS